MISIDFIILMDRLNKLVVHSIDDCEEYRLAWFHESHEYVEITISVCWIQEQKEDGAYWSHNPQDSVLNAVSRNFYQNQNERRWSRSIQSLIWVLCNSDEFLYTWTKATSVCLTFSRSDVKCFLHRIWEERTRLTSLTARAWWGRGTTLRFVDSVFLCDTVVWSAVRLWALVV